MLNVEITSANEFLSKPFEQICANLDSVIVSTKNFLPELKDVVPKPKKRYDIVNELPFVSTY